LKKESLNSPRIRNGRIGCERNAIYFKVLSSQTGPKVRDHWEDVGVGGRREDNIKLDLRELGIDGGELDSAGSG
jgi:hypothetical protein